LLAFRQDHALGRACKEQDKECEEIFTKPTHYCAPLAQDTMIENSFDF
jgi:hypothetical protein